MKKKESVIYTLIVSLAIIVIITLVYYYTSSTTTKVEEVTGIVIDMRETGGIKSHLEIVVDIDGFRVVSRGNQETRKLIVGDEVQVAKKIIYNKKGEVINISYGNIKFNN